MTSVSSDLVVIQIDRARVALLEANTIQDTKKILDVAAAAEIYAKRQQLSQEAIDYAHSLKIEALRQIGQMLKESAKAVGGQPYQRATGADVEPVGDRVPTLSDLGLTKKISSIAQKLAALPAEQFEEVKTGSATIANAIREVNADRQSEALRQAQDAITSGARDRLADVFEARCCSCAELFASGIRPDAVITDPPYPREFLPVFSELGSSCKGVPIVAVMSGQAYLPEVFARLCEHLAYRWTMAYLTPGGQAVQAWASKVNAFWKPVLVFGAAGDWIGDVAKSRPNDNDKRFHEWGQSESGMADLIERLTKPGDLVCDPFMGGGATAIACLSLGRRFIGCDIDASHVENATRRVEASCAK